MNAARTFSPEEIWRVAQMTPEYFQCTTLHDGARAVRACSGQSWRRLGFGLQVPPATSVAHPVEVPPPEHLRASAGGERPMELEALPPYGVIGIYNEGTEDDVRSSGVSLDMHGQSPFVMFGAFSLDPRMMARDYRNSFSRHVWVDVRAAMARMDFYPSQGGMATDGENGWLDGSLIVQVR